MAYKVKKAQIAPLLEVAFPEYAGRKFSVEFCELVRLYNLNWDGSTKNDYVAISMGTGNSAELPERAPWSNPFEGQVLKMTEDMVIAKHTFFCGQDMGVTFYAHPRRRQEFQALGCYDASTGVIR
jgi:hypothetical protein